MPISAVTYAHGLRDGSSSKSYITTALNASYQSRSIRLQLSSIAPWLLVQVPSITSLVVLSRRSIFGVFLILHSRVRAKHNRPDGAGRPQLVAIVPLAGLVSGPHYPCANGCILDLLTKLSQALPSGQVPLPSPQPFTVVRLVTYVLRKDPDSFNLARTR